MSAKPDTERGIFERFACDAGLIVRAQSISQPDPPDIRCEVEGFGPVAFELVQLDDATELQRLGYLTRSQEFWADAAKDLPPETLERHRGAQVNVVFDPEANQGRRRAALALIASWLDNLPAGIEAVFGGLPPGLRSAELKHFPSMTDGPLVREVSEHSVKFEGPQCAPVGIHLDRIDKKIAQYPDGWGVRAELLAYARWGMPFSDQMHSAPQYLANLFPGGVFARGWIYEVTSRRVVARAP
jgi:hypothetical protein